MEHSRSAEGTLVYSGASERGTGGEGAAGPPPSVDEATAHGWATAHHYPWAACGPGGKWLLPSTGLSVAR